MRCHALPSVERYTPSAVPASRWPLALRRTFTRPSPAARAAALSARKKPSVVPSASVDMGSLLLVGQLAQHSKEARLFGLRQAMRGRVLCQHALFEARTQVEAGARQPHALHAAVIADVPREQATGFETGDDDGDVGRVGVDA